MRNAKVTELQAKLFQTSGLDFPNNNMHSRTELADI